MARIELRHATIRIKDGFSGTGAVNESTTPPADGDTDFDIDTAVVNGKLGTDVIPIGARFTVTGAGDVVYTVTGRTPADGSATTTNIEFAPALATEDGLPVDDAAITFLPQQIDVKVGDGNLTYTENAEYEYELDRGQLDTVREGNQVPMDVNLDFVYEFVTTGTGEAITPMDAIKGRGGAAEWVSSSADPCEPYAVDVEVEHIPPCGGADKEISIFPDFRADSKEFDLGEATVSVSGRCNATEPTLTRVSQS